MSKAKLIVKRLIAEAGKSQFSPGDSVEVTSLDRDFPFVFGATVVDTNPGDEKYGREYASDVDRGLDNVVHVNVTSFDNDHADEEVPLYDEIENASKDGSPLSIVSNGGRTYIEAGDWQTDVSVKKVSGKK